nr:MAG TPA: Immune Mapped Protein 2 (IMP2) N-terminal domain [Caudoviricetes sp.]
MSSIFIFYDIINYKLFWEGWCLFMKLKKFFKLLF